MIGKNTFAVISPEDRPEARASRPSSSWRRKILKAAALVGLLAAVFAIGIGASYWIRLRASLPQLDGVVSIRGLRSEVTILRDGLGVPTIQASDRIDLARATGFVHAQDRFFQMDLLRRKGAGELAEVIGPVMIPSDRKARLHRFRAAASAVIAQASEEERAVIEAYAEGVNAGLAALGERPFEYLLLRSEVREWSAADSVLVLFAMFFELQDDTGKFDSDRFILRDALPTELAAFLGAEGNEWDAPLVGEAMRVPDPPSAEVFELLPEESKDGVFTAQGHAAGDALPSEYETVRFDHLPGSNAWAVSGERTSHGDSALVAGDMHLGLSLPHVWYRARFEWLDQDGRERHVTGVTLPGSPAMIVGSNGFVAWSFTNAYGDWSDLVEIELDPRDPTRYLMPAGSEPFENIVEEIHVRGWDEPERMEIKQTIWGPVIDRNHRGQVRAIAWVAHHPRAVNLGVMKLESARNLEQAMAIAQRAGMPQMNFVVGDSEGRIGWTIAGAIPERHGFDGRFPRSWARGDRGWSGWIDPARYPRLVDPEDGRIWSANARATSGDDLRLLGMGRYALGARAMQIRDALGSLEDATPADMLGIQLDDRALFLGRWRDLLLEVFDGEAGEGISALAQMRPFVEQWGGHAAVDSVGYRIVRAFRIEVWKAVFEPFIRECRKRDERFSYGSFRQSEGPLWSLLEKRPKNLLDPRYESWEELLVRAAERTRTNLEDGEGLEGRTWGEQNTLRMQHPLSRAIPMLGRWLDMPAQALPGDTMMPRVQGVRFGASQRMAVSPGYEEEGILHMPGGASGHPLSPYYAAGHEAWVRGEPSPLLPGETRHRLTLLPDPSAGRPTPEEEP